MAKTRKSGRRTFLKQMASVAGAAPLAPMLMVKSAAAAAADEEKHAPTNGHETMRLAEYAAALQLDKIPPEAVQRAKDCIADTVAVILSGADLPWSKMIVAYAQKNGAGGKSRILGSPGVLVHAPSAALAHGALTHAFEQDSLTKPDSGAHPGAALLSSTLAVAQERGLSGRALLTAFIAGSEAMIRIGFATKHTNEARGFHAPGTTSPFGGAVAVARLLDLDAVKTANAMGIAGSCSAGLLEFAHSDGAMVKRLHLGRGAESGVLAASLAAEGYTGPTTVLEGGNGFLRVFCTDYDLGELTKGLGESYVTMTIMLKRFACHITAHNPVEAILDLSAMYGFGGNDVVAIDIAGNERMAKVNNIPAPKDVLMAQYSIPFSVALALYRDPRDPDSFDDSAVHDPAIRKLASLVTMTVLEGQDRRNLATEVTVTLRDGRVVFRRVNDFKGTPQRPLDRDELRDKFLVLTKKHDYAKMKKLFDRLQNIENEKDVDWIGA
ncbi:MAG TPA: MmgE/PrpD family protein [Pseudolabrys sp.]|nr:MmgE/PrpD family protein [Pseudolabrys sp.]